ncbi:pyridoxal 5'-phosphate synthase glutaminase subunit PdxT [Symbioplanes lichenis]|uniref:pyridoxal 5'-phosphate synthase glutaminase subunit PdxT n=1 Tax=Symbioplanes lichenis TaxID=1629072 RepID=UPI00273A4FB2|nr:pyridoxal 5'-phosphate synthase glutaminase subunit PdxT [Actinoplanes lichenis]
MTSVRIGVLALQGDVREHLSALAGSDVLARPVRRPAELDDVDALVIPGGESTTISHLALAFGLMGPVRERIAGGMPAYGSCAGMIMLAATVLDGRPDQESFGGIDMTVRRNAFGRQVDSFEAAVGIDGVAGGDFHAVFIRAPWVEKTSGDATVLGRVKDGPAAGRIVAVRQGNLLATAFHPELTGDLRVHRYFVEMVRQAADAR